MSFTSVTSFGDKHRISMKDKQDKPKYIFSLEPSVEVKVNKTIQEIENSKNSESA